MNKTLRFALFVLRHLYPKQNREPIMGDLIEQFREGQSGAWLWRQMIIAVANAAASRLRLILADVCVVLAAVVVIYAVPWGLIFPIDSMLTSRIGWAVRFSWVTAIEAMTGLLVASLFAALFIARRVFNWNRLLRVYLTLLVLLMGADLPILNWSLQHRVLSPSETVSLIQVQWLCILAVLIISAAFARHLSVSRPSLH